MLQVFGFCSFILIISRISFAVLEKRTKSTDFMLEKRTKLFLASLALGVLPATASADVLGSNESGHLVINEIMQSNIDQLMVEHDFPDSWVELYNPTDKAVNISGYRIGKEPDLESSYLFPHSHNVPAHGYRLIYCDKKGNDTHPDFRLESTSSGSIYLFSPDGEVIDSLRYPEMPAPNIAYGRRADSDADWQYELIATPGAANEGGGSSTLLPSPVFSLSGRIMSESAELQITMPEGFDLPSDTRIYLTNNGEEPTFESPSATEFRLTIDHTLTVRAKLLSAHALPSRAATHSYIFHPRELHLPIVSLVTDSAYLYSEDNGILLGGLPLGTGNCYKDWRRPVNIEYFEQEDDDATINQLGETEVGGLGSRIYSQKSLKLYAHKRFGKKQFKAQFWPEDKPDITAVEKFRLRNGGNRCIDTRFEDALAQRIFARWKDSLEWIAYSPVIGYINGEYKGIFGLREKCDEDYLESNYGISEEVDIVESFYTDAPEYAEIMQLIDDESATFADFEAIMEMSQFIDYLCCETYATNEDFPHNNVYMWKTKGGKWHFVLKDLDYFSNSQLGFNYLNWLMATGDEGKWALQPIKHRLIQKLMMMEEFREAFIDRMGIYLGDFLRPDVTLPLIRQMRDEIDSEVAATFAEMSEEVSYADFDRTINQRLIPYCEQRPLRAYNQFAQYYSLGDVIPMTIYPQGNPILVNNVGLTQSQFEGCTWLGRKLRLDSRTPAAGWAMTVTYLNGSMKTFRYEQPSVSIHLAETVGACESVAFTTISIDPGEGIECVVNDETKTPVGFFTIYGMPCSNAGGDVRLVRDPDGTFRKIIRY